MGHERLKHIKENLMSAIEGQVCNLAEADCNELGEAIDMLKDLEEALYFCTITEAMEKTETNGEKSNGHQSYMYYSEPYYYTGYSHPGDGGYLMYDTGRNGSSQSNGGHSSSNAGMNGSNSYYTEPTMTRDYREGRSPMSRKMYMEAKEHKGEKSSQLKELERYMQELTQDMVDMIQEATPEEKQYLEKKISALATKIGQMK